MNLYHRLAGAFVLALTLACSAAEAQTAVSLVDGADGDRAEVVRLSCIRSSDGADAASARSIETCTLFAESCGVGQDSKPIWRDERSWESRKLGVGPTVGRVLVRHDDRDAIIALVSVESSLGWGSAVRVDVFRVSTKAAGATSPVKSAPLASLLRPCGRPQSSVVDVLMGERRLAVILRDRAENERVFYLDLDSPEWHETTIADAPVEGIERRPNMVFVAGAGGPTFEESPPTSRPLPK